MSGPPRDIDQLQVDLRVNNLTKAKGQNGRSLETRTNSKAVDFQPSFSSDGNKVPEIRAIPFRPAGRLFFSYAFANLAAVPVKIQGRRDDNG
jgi:hypothetical protein